MTRAPCTSLVFIAALGLTAGTAEFPDSLSFFSSLCVSGNLVVVSSPAGVGKLPGGMDDSDGNISYAPTNSFAVGDYIRLQGGQHNCYWEILAVSNNWARMRFFGHVRPFGEQNRIFWASSAMRECLCATRTAAKLKP